LVRDNYKMLKVRPSDEVVKKLSTDLEAFKIQLPLLQEVRSSVACLLKHNSCLSTHVT
jgi:hypothetical protein